MNAIRRGVQNMHSHAKQSKSAWKRILNPSTEGAGGRVYPPNGAPKENKIGLRLDKGEGVHGKPGFVRLKLQVNKNAEDATLKKCAQEDSHRVWATVDVDTTQEANEENLNNFFQALESSVNGD